MFKIPKRTFINNQYHYFEVGWNYKITPHFTVRRRRKNRPINGWTVGGPFVPKRTFLYFHWLVQRLVKVPLSPKTMSLIDHRWAIYWPTTCRCLCRWGLPGTVLTPSLRSFLKEPWLVLGHVCPDVSNPNMNFSYFDDLSHEFHPKWT